MAKYLDYDGLLYFWGKLKEKFVTKETGKGLSTNDLTNELLTKLNELENYTLPEATDTVLGGVKIGTGLSITAGVLSVTSAGSVTWDGITGKPTTLTGYGITDCYTKTEVDAKISSVYKPGGSFAFASLPTPAASVLGYVYNVTDAFTTTSAFIEGAGKTYPAGSNIAVIINDGSYYFDVLPGFVDLSGYLPIANVITNTEIDTIVAA